MHLQCFSGKNTSDRRWTKYSNPGQIFHSATPRPNLNVEIWGTAVFILGVWFVLSTRPMSPNRFATLKFGGKGVKDLSEGLNILSIYGRIRMRIGLKNLKTAICGTWAIATTQNIHFYTNSKTQTKTWHHVLWRWWFSFFSFSVGPWSPPTASFCSSWRVCSSPAQASKRSMMDWRPGDDDETWRFFFLGGVVGVFF